MEQDKANAPKLDEATIKALRQLSNLVAENARKRRMAEASRPRNAGADEAPEAETEGETAHQRGGFTEKQIDDMGERLKRIGLSGIPIVNPYQNWLRTPHHSLCDIYAFLNEIVFAGELPAPRMEYWPDLKGEPLALQLAHAGEVYIRVDFGELSRRIPSFLESPRLLLSPLLEIMAEAHGRLRGDKSGNGPDRPGPPAGFGPRMDEIIDRAGNLVAGWGKIIGLDFPAVSRPIADIPLLRPDPFEMMIVCSGLDDEWRKGGEWSRGCPQRIPTDPAKPAVERDSGAGTHETREGAPESASPEETHGDAAPEPKANANTEEAPEKRPFDPWRHDGSPVTRTERLLAIADDGVRCRLERARMPPWELAGMFQQRPADDHSWVEGGAPAFLAELFDAAMDGGIGAFADAAWLFGAFASEETWRLMHGDMEWIWNARAGFHGKKAPDPADAENIVEDIDRLRECTRRGEPALFRGTGFGEEVPFAEVSGYLEGRGACASTAMQFWFEHAWRLLAKAGLTQISADNPRETVAVHAETLAMLTEEFQSLALDEADTFEHHDEEHGFLSFRQQRMVLGVVEGEEAARLREELRAADEESLEDDGAEWAPDWKMERDVAACILEDDRPRVAKALGMGERGGADNFCALWLTVWFPTALCEEIADEIERVHPVLAEPIRLKDDFDSFEEYERFVEDDRVGDEICNGSYGFDDPGKQAAFEWYYGGTWRIGDD